MLSNSTGLSHLPALWAAPCPRAGVSRRFGSPAAAPSLPGSGAAGSRRSWHRLSVHRLLCRTLEPEGAFTSFQPLGDIGYSNGQINAMNARPQGGSNETFQQLRQAVLSSLDFSDNAEATQDWDDNYDDGSEDTFLEPLGVAAAAGKAVYQTLRIDKAGKVRQVIVRRRDLIRQYRLQPRDLRRVDPSLSPTKTSPSVAIKEGSVLINIGGVRAVISEEKCLLFEPTSGSSRKFLQIVSPRLQGAAAAERARAQGLDPYGGGSHALETVSMSMNMSIDGYSSSNEAFETEARASAYPFELEIFEAALMVATGKLEAELVAATRRVGAVLQKLPREITPVNLEELRRVKQLLVELESKAENLRDMLTELMDDEDEVRELNLSTRPKREELRRQRERDRLEREVERERAVDSSRAAAAGGGGSGEKGGAWDGGAGLSNTGGTGTALQSASEEFLWKKQEEEDELEEERELEEVEDLLEYYLQRAATTQSEAERLLAGARDLEESIGVSLSARRFEVNRLELMLSIASFAAALGAMVASIFGMNLRSTLEMSVVGFWSTTLMIVAGSCWIFWVLYNYTKRKRIL